MFRKCWLLIPLLLTPLRAQQAANQEKLLQEVLRRLDNLEQQNRELIEQVKELKEGRAQTAAVSEGPKAGATAPLEERVNINEARIAEQAQTKVESGQKLPVWLSGTLLFNAFSNSKDPTYAFGQYGLLTGPSPSGATFRQTTLGMAFEGPTLPGGGQVRGDLAMDFWAGPPNPSDNWLRIRKAGITLDWVNRSVFFGQDKPLISPYEPNSLAEVGVPPLAGAGNLWFWVPQVRFEEKIHLSANSGINAQVAALQVGSYLLTESPSTDSSIYTGGARPAFEGRLAFWHKDRHDRKFEFAPGVHVSSNQVDGAKLMTQIGSVDWSYRPFAKLEWKGTGYYGGNVASLGSLGNGFYETSEGALRPVHSAGGWTQFSLPINTLITLNAFGGVENDHALGVSSSDIARSTSFATNAMFHLSANVLLSVEAQRLWTRTFAGFPEAYNHYDLAVAYLF